MPKKSAIMNQEEIKKLAPAKIKSFFELRPFTSAKLDLITLLTCAIVILASGYRLFFTQYRWHNEQEGSLASLNSMENTVKIRPSGIPGWFDGQRETPLFVKDQVFTANDASAEIKFNNGQVMNLMEKTLIVIGKQENTNTIKVESGILETKLLPEGEGLLIDMQGRPVMLKAQAKETTIQIIKTETNVKGNKDQETKSSSTLHILSGDASFEHQGKVIQVSPQDIVKVNSKGEIKKVAFPLTYTFPNNAMILPFVPKQQFEMTWRGATKGPLQLEVASNRKFSQSSIIFNSRLATPNKAKQNVSFSKAGLYFWRLKVLDSNQQWLEGPIRHFELADISTPITITPKGKTLPTDSLGFYWSGQKGAAQTYKLEIKKQSGEVLTHISSSSNLTLPLTSLSTASSTKEASQWEWRVQSHYKGLESKFSNWQHFTLMQKASITLPQINPIAPLNGHEEFQYQEKPNAIVLQWNDVFQNSQDEATADNLLSYEIEIYLADKTDGRPILSTFAKNQAVSIHLPLYSKFSWRVRAVSRQEQKLKGTWSNMLHFNLRHVAPLEGLPFAGAQIEIEKPGMDVEFSWKKTLKSDGSKDNLSASDVFLFELASDQEFKQIIQQEKTSAKNIKIPFSKTGVFYWRTKLIGKDGHTEYSRPFKVEVTPTPPPQKMQLPKEQEIEIKWRIKSSSIKSSGGKLFKIILDLIFPSSLATEYEFFAPIEWPAYPRAKHYILHIYSDEKMQDLIFETTVVKPYYEWKSPQPGSYFYQIAAVDYWDQQGPFSQPVRLDLKAAEISLRPPKIKYHSKAVKNNNSITIPISFDQKTSELIMRVQISQDLQGNEKESKSESKTFTLPLDKKSFTFKTPTQAGEIKMLLVAKSPTGMQVRSKPLFLTIQVPPPPMTMTKRPTMVKYQKEKIKQIMPEPDYQVGFFYAANKVQNSQKTGTLEAKVEGNTLMAFESQLQKKNIKRLRYFPAKSAGLDFRYSHGQIFSTLSYTQYNLSGYALFEVKKSDRATFSLGPQIALSGINDLSISSSGPTQSKTTQVLSFAAIISSSLKLQEHKLEINASYYAVGLHGPELELKYLYRLKRFTLSTGLNFKSRSYESSGNAYNFNELGAIAGPTFYF